MKHDTTFAVIGGDQRQSCLAKLIQNDGKRVSALCMEKNNGLSESISGGGDISLILPQSDVVIFPLPISSDNLLLNAPFCEKPPLLSEVLRYISPEAAVFGGMVSARVHEMARYCGFSISDYYEREELVVRNCVPTAEGALEIAMQETAKTIFRSHCLVTGFGRVARAMTQLLLACGAKVSVAARRQSDLAWISMMGARPVNMANLEKAAQNAEIIFNTVPVKLFGRAELQGLSNDCLIIDLASKPGGADLPM